MSESSTGKSRAAGRGPEEGGARASEARADAAGASTEAGSAAGGPDAAAGSFPASGDGGAREAREPPKLVRQLRDRREAYKGRGTAYRAAWVTAGVIVVVAGLVMVVFPGPALVVIPIGLAMLSLEFAWAERLLDSTLERGLDAKDIALGASRKQKIVGAAAIVCAVAAAAAIVLLYLV